MGPRRARRARRGGRRRERDGTDRDPFDSLRVSRPRADAGARAGRVSRVADRPSRRLAAPRPTLLAPGAPDAWHDADLVPAERVVLLPIPIEREGSTALHPATWTEAAALFLAARLRGAHFENPPAVRPRGRAAAGPAARAARGQSRPRPERPPERSGPAAAGRGAARVRASRRAGSRDGRAARPLRARAHAEPHPGPAALRSRERRPFLRQGAPHRALAAADRGAARRDAGRSRGGPGA